MEEITISNWDYNHLVELIMEKDPLTYVYFLMDKGMESVRDWIKKMEKL